MKRFKWLLVGLVVLCLAIVLLAGCGVPQSEYEALQDENTALVTENANLEAELQQAQSDLTSLQADYDEVCVKLEQGKARIEILNAIFLPAMTGELDRMTEGETVNYFLEWRDQVNAVGDPVLTAKFDAMIDSGGSDEAFAAFFLYLLESIPGALE